MTGRDELRVLSAGPLTTVQDLGRAGHMDVGVPPSGALDSAAHRLAQRLVGNPESAAGLEVTLGGLEVALGRAAVVAVTGAEADVTVAGRLVATGVPVQAPAGARVRIGPVRSGLRAHLAVSGGIGGPELFGSRSADVLSGLGPAPLSGGDVVPLLAAGPGPGTWVDVAPMPPRPHVIEVRLHPGPRVDWFAAGEFDALCTRRYTVDPRSNRVGLRLAGTPLERVVERELPSEGIVTGAVEVPGDGVPLIFLADHPTTGGYPVIAVVEPGDLPALAQAAPGDVLAFRPVRGA